MSIYLYKCGYSIVIVILCYCTSIIARTKYNVAKFHSLYYSIYVDHNHTQYSVARRATEYIRINTFP